MLYVYICNTNHQDECTEHANQDQSLKLYVLYCAAIRHHKCERRLYSRTFFNFLSGVLQILVHACEQEGHILWNGVVCWELLIQQNLILTS